MNQDCLTCPYRGEVSELKTKYSTSRKEMYGRIEDVEKAVAITKVQYDELKGDIKDLKTQQEKDFKELKSQQEKDFNDLKAQQQAILAKIESISQQPGKRWDTAITVTITAIITSVINFASSHLGGAA